MRVAQVVALDAPDGSYGGPLSVAREQCEQLSRLGHEVTLFAGHLPPPPILRAKAEAPYRLSHHRVLRAPRAKSMSSLISPSLLRRVRSDLRQFDVFHVHLARDLTTMPIARLLAPLLPVVVQTHGMVPQRDGHVSSLYDRLLTRPVLARAGRVLYLTEHERRDLEFVSRNTARLQKIWNGVRLSPNYTSRADRQEVVLFCARLHPRKRVGAFLDMAELVAAQVPTVRFVIAGPDEGDLTTVRARLDVTRFRDRISYVGGLAPEEVAEVLGSSLVFVLPSFEEPFPMTALESMAFGTPAVITTSCGIAQDALAVGAAAVTGGTPEALAESVLSLLADETRWNSQRLSGARLVDDKYSSMSVAVELEGIYVSLLGRSPS